MQSKTDSGELAVFCFAVFCVVHGASALLSRAIFPQHFGALTEQERVDWHGRVTGSCFALLASVLGAVEYFSPSEGLSTSEDRFFSASIRSHFLMSFAAGFFAWDALYCAIGRQGPMFVAHACAGLFAYANTLGPFMQHQGCFFLLWEISTPFLNLRSQLLACKRTDSTLFRAVSVAFALSFLGVRWLIGMPGSAIWYVESYQLIRAGHPLLRPRMLCTALALNLMLNVFNVMWGLKVAKGLVRALGGADEKSKA